MLQRFESFIPKNVEKRKEDLKKIIEKEAKNLNELAVILSEIVKKFKDIKVDDEREQFFINKFIDCQVKVDHYKYPNAIFFFDQKKQYLAEYRKKQLDSSQGFMYTFLRGFLYDSEKENEFLISNDIWSLLKSNYSLKYNQVKQLTKTWVEEHFKLKPITTTTRWLSSIPVVEEHFKLRPVTTSNI